MNKIILLLLPAILLSSCIKDDFVDDRVDPEIRLILDIDTIEVNSTYQLDYLYLNNVGAEESANVAWSSSDDNIITINDDGLAKAHNVGDAIITVSFSTEEGETVVDNQMISVGQTTVIIEQKRTEGRVETTTFYTLTGSYSAFEEDSATIIEFGEDYEASTALPGLYIYLSNNKTSIANALEIGRVEVFNGGHSYRIEDTKIDDYSYIVYFCKPFNVKVGDGEF